MNQPQGHQKVIRTGCSFSELVVMDGLAEKWALNRGLVDTGNVGRAVQAEGRVRAELAWTYGNGSDVSHAGGGQ